MTQHLRLSLLLLVGCAAQIQTVPAADWNTVPAAQREKLDREYQADVAAAQTELRVTTAAVIEARHTLAAARAAARKPGPAAALPDTLKDEWSMAVREHERSKRDAVIEVDTANIAWLTANLAWRQLRLDTATARIALLGYERELARAKAIDHFMLGTETYDSAVYRGQLAHAQERWYDASTHATAARDALAQASVRLTASKETYAKLMRTGPATPADPAQMRLSGWNVAVAARPRGTRTASCYENTRSKVRLRCLSSIDETKTLLRKP
jgi:hypothetical protein